MYRNSSPMAHYVAGCVGHGAGEIGKSIGPTWDLGRHRLSGRYYHMVYLADIQGLGAVKKNTYYIQI